MLFQNIFVIFTMITLFLFSSIGNGQAISQVNVTSSSICYEMVYPPDDNPIWSQGLDMNLDMVQLCADVVAYKLRWSTTLDSDWYVTGINDINPILHPEYGLRRMWSYFQTHYHTCVICKSNKYKINSNDTKC
ncbi:unnamed protein product [Adineta steineri]|uniref:Uncharacterized protein n=1 Tax=Adineta steineri TaxID=433720 RepID=A0A814DIW2_9BILA|nr:unnamed protein product [Adineta steineri]CAF1293051.1 unnamed protein product [Adineta steineri]CAF3714249.1 unnamed protein product [Adineta steineri]CAF4036250.1 unnamed protein product [Adineta steineri]